MIADPLCPNAMSVGWTERSVTVTNHVTRRLSSEARPSAAGAQDAIRTRIEVISCLRSTAPHPVDQRRRRFHDPCSLRNTALSWIIVSVSDTAEMMEKSSGNGFSVGLGLTNECNLACAHCYRDTGRIDRLSLDDVQRVCENVPVRSVNLWDR